MMNTPPDKLGIFAADLAPGDKRSTRFDWTDVTVRHVRTTEDADFEPAYVALWAEFGEKNELETRDVLAERLTWRPEERTPDGTARLYDFVVIRRGDDIAAIADHTAVVNVNRDGPAVVHVSHILVTPQFRGSGLAGWVRALPIRTARDCLHRVGLPPRPITLVGEMEHAAIERPDGFGRLIAFEKAGFLKIDPKRVPYAQPDFRSAVEIAADRLRPVPLSLVVRRVGRDHETVMRGSELNELMLGLFTVYENLMNDESKALFRQLANAFSQRDEYTPLIPPTAV